MTYLELVKDPDARAEELIITGDGVTVAVEKVDGRLTLRAQDGERGEPVIIDLHDVAPMLLAWIVDDEMHAANRQEQDDAVALYRVIRFAIGQLFPERESDPW